MKGSIISITPTILVIKVRTEITLKNPITTIDVDLDECTLEAATGYFIAKWVPCSEKMPDVEGRYLCTQDKWVGICKYAKNLRDVCKYEFPKNKPGWYDFDDEYGYYEVQGVTAWMRKPDPY